MVVNISEAFLNNPKSGKLHLFSQAVHADTSIHPDLLNSRFAYVSISRASLQATLFTDDLAKLGPQLAADVSKTSALEMGQR